MDAWTLYAWQRVEEHFREDIRELRQLIKEFEDVCKSLHSDQT